MAVDRGYGSGKPRSAANSAARRAAAGKAASRKKTIQKQASKPFQKLRLASVGKQAAAGFNIDGRQYLEAGVSANKLLQVAKSLLEGGQTAFAKTVWARAEAKQAGKFFGGTGKKSQGLGLPMDRAVDVGGAARAISERVYPRLPSRGGDAPSLLRGQRDLRTFDQYADPINEGAGRFKSQNLLESMIQGSKSRSGMNRVKTASEVAKALAKYKAPRRGR